MGDSQARQARASVGQRLLSLMDHYRGAGSSLNEQVLWRMRGPCDRLALQRAIDELVCRHEALRTSFAARGPRLTQIVHPPRPVGLYHVDVSREADPATAARARLATEATTPIDAAAWPTRPTLIRLGPEDHLLTLTMHHFVSDDWSNALVARDIRQLYAAIAGEPGAEPLPPVPWQYADWSDWHHDRLAGPEGERLQEYWRTKLAGARTPVLPSKTAPGGPAGGLDRVMAKGLITAPVLGTLRKIASRQRTTLFPVMLAIFGGLLHRSTGQDDVAVASLFANRGRPEVRDTVGFFVSMLLLRCQTRPDAPFADAVAQARTTVMEAIRHQELPYQLLPPGTVDTGGGRADDVTFQFVGSLTTRADMVGAEYYDLQVQLSRRRFACEFILVPKGEHLSALLLGAADRLDQDWAEGFVRDYVALAEAVAADPDRTMTELMGAAV